VPYWLYCIVPDGVPEVAYCRATVCAAQCAMRRMEDKSENWPGNSCHHDDEEQIQKLRELRRELRRHVEALRTRLAGYPLWNGATRYYTPRLKFLRRKMQGKTATQAASNCGSYLRLLMCRECLFLRLGVRLRSYRLNPIPIDQYFVRCAHATGSASAFFCRSCIIRSFSRCM